MDFLKPYHLNFSPCAQAISSLLSPPPLHPPAARHEHSSMAPRRSKLFETKELVDAAAGKSSI